MTLAIGPGDVGAAVRDVQSRLVRWALRQGPEDADLAQLVVDGDFGEATHEAVRRFQRQRGLPADGTVGEDTWRALVEAGYALGDRLLWHSRTMMRGDDVLELQHQLNRLGFDAGPEDGLFGPLARHAVTEFQRDAGLSEDGVAGPRTLAALSRLVRDFQSGGIGVRVREQEGLRRLIARGFHGARLLVDPAGGPDDGDGDTVSGAAVHALTWALGSRLAAELAAAGVQTRLSRGPGTTPTSSERARLANRLDVDIVVTLAVAVDNTPGASGSATYYFGSPRFTSESGRELAELVQEAVIAAGHGPDCRTHPTAAGVVRETKMTAVLLETGFAGSEQDCSRLEDSSSQGVLVRAVAAALRQFVERRDDGGRGAQVSASSRDARG